jgi:hypothetical protein
LLYRGIIQVCRQAGIALVDRYAAMANLNPAITNVHTEGKDQCSSYKSREWFKEFWRFTAFNGFGCVVHFPSRTKIVLL